MLIDFLFRRSSTVDPDRALARGDYAAAISGFRRLMAAEPRKAATCHRRIGEALALSGQSSAALAELMLAAGHFEDRGRILEAIPVYQAILRLDPGNLVVRERIGELALEDEIALGEKTWMSGPVTLGVHLRNRAPLFSMFTADELTVLLPLLTVVRLDTGRTIYRSGEPADALFIVISGEVALTEGEGAEAQIECGRIGVGGHFGLLSETAGAVRSHDAISSRTTELIELHREGLETASARHPRVWRVVEDFQAVVPVGAP